MFVALLTKLRLWPAFGQLQGAGEGIGLDQRLARLPINQAGAGLPVLWDGGMDGKVQTEGILPVRRRCVLLHGGDADQFARGDPCREPVWME